ncbi:hypothetical protein PO909_022066 [Leuciscus waleckii]
MLQPLALGIMAQPGVCKHTYKIMLSERPSMMMSGGPSGRMSGRLSVTMSRCLSVMKSVSPLMMMSGDPSMRRFGRLAMIMSEGPSMRMFGRLSVMSESSSVMMFGWLAMMMSGGPSMRMFGRLLMMIFESPSMMMFGRLSVMMFESSSLRMLRCLSVKISERSSKKISEKPSKKISGNNNKEFQEQKPDGEGNLEYESRFKQDIRVAQYTGLVNQGATCYLNTVLQILFMTEDFRKAVERYESNNSISNINNLIAQLFMCLKPGGRNTATTEAITAELKINVHKQEDAAKCLQKILNMVDPEISKIFQGTKVDTTVCNNPPNAHDPLKQVKTFFIISISLESQDRLYLQSCFESYFASIIMCGEDQQIYCKDCERMMDTETICSLQKVPSVLVLHLERFEFDYDTMCCVKNYSPVQIPAQLSVRDEAGVNHMYDLYAIANHSGSLSGGHYYADIKSFEDQQWYRFNDDWVDQMCNFKCDLDNPFNSDKAYLLLYKKPSHSQTAEEEPILEEGTSSKCVIPENDETVTDNKVHVELEINSSLAEQPAESTNTSACDGCPDVPGSTIVTIEHQTPLSLSEHSEYNPETNASAQQMMTDEESKSLMGTNDVSNTSEIVNKIPPKKQLWIFVIFSLALILLLLLLLLLFII